MKRFIEMLRRQYERAPKEEKDAKKQKLNKLWSFVDKFGQKIEAEFDEYQEALDYTADKVADYSGYSLARARLDSDGVVTVIQVDLKDSKEVTFDKTTCKELTGVEIIDARSPKSYEEAVEFFRLLTECDSIDELDCIAMMYPSRMKDKDVQDYYDFCKEEFAEY